jgi:hypothetical protein
LFSIYAVMALVPRIRPQGLFQSRSTEKNLCDRLRIFWARQSSAVGGGSAFTPLGDLVGDPCDVHGARGLRPHHLWRGGLVPFSRALFFATVPAFACRAWFGVTDAFC